MPADKHHASQPPDIFFAKYPFRSYPKGQILIHANDNPGHIYYLVRGKVRQYDISYRGDEIIVNVYKPGAFFPLMNALTELPNRYFFDAETAIEVRIAPIEEVVEFLKTNPEVMYDLLARLYRGLDGLLGRMARLMAGSAKSRLLYELVIECRRFGKTGKDGHYELAVNESDLAARAGLSRETVSREIRKISQDGLIDAKGQKGIKIRSLKELETKLGLDL